MAKQTIKKTSKRQRKRRINSIIIGFLAVGLILSTFIGILISAIG